MLQFIPAQDYQRYQEMYNQHKTNMGIPAASCQSLLAPSGLSSQVLASIWNLSCIGNGHYLSLPEFCLLMFLTKSCISGASLPSELPLIVKQQVIAAMSQQITPQSTGSYISPHPTGNFPVSQSPRMTTWTTNSSPQLSSHSNFSNPQTQFTAVRPQMAPTFAIPQQPQIIPPQMSVPAAPQVPWAISSSEKAQFDAIFRSYDPENTGFIDGSRAQQLFSQSGLRGEMLAHIWNLADIHERGKLDIEEFAVAMHLVYMRLNGQDIPQKLPLELVPPSARELASLSNLAKLQASTQEPIRRISPSSSIIGLQGIARPAKPATVPVVDSVVPEQDLQKQTALAKEVESQRSTLAQLKQSAEKYEKESTSMEMKFKSYIAEAIELHGRILKLIRKRDNTQAKPLLAVDIERFVSLENKISSLLTSITKKIEERARIKTEKAKKLAGKDANQGESVANKAAALLAARMAALGVQSTLEKEQSTTKPTLNLAEELARIDKESALAKLQLETISNRFAIFKKDVDVLKRLVTSAPIWDPPVADRVKYEQGVLKSRNGLKAFLEVKNAVGAVGLEYTKLIQGSDHKALTPEKYVDQTPLPNTSAITAKSNFAIDKTEHSDALQQAEEVLRASRERINKLTSATSSPVTNNFPSHFDAFRNSSSQRTEVTTGFVESVPKNPIPFETTIDSRADNSISNNPFAVLKGSQIPNVPETESNNPFFKFAHPESAKQTNLNSNNQEPKNLFQQNSSPKKETVVEASNGDMFAGKNSALKAILQKEKEAMEKKKEEERLLNDRISKKTSRSPSPQNVINNSSGAAKPPSPHKPVDEANIKVPDLFKPAIDVVDRPKTPPKPQLLREKTPPPKFPKPQSPEKILKSEDAFSKVSLQTGPTPPKPQLAREKTPPLKFPKPQSPEKISKSEDAFSKVALETGPPPPPPPPPPMISEIKPQTQKPPLPNMNNSDRSTHASVLASALASQRKNLGGMTDTESGEESGWDSVSASSPIKAGFAEGSQIPPPPPPPPLASADGTVVLKIPSNGQETLKEEKKKKIDPKEIGAQGPNLFALMTQGQAALKSTGKQHSKQQEEKPAHAIKNEEKKKNDWEIVDAEVSPNVMSTPEMVDKNDAFADETEFVQTQTKPILYEAVACFEYQSDAQDDLVVIEGDILKVKEEQGEWVYATNENGASGWLPKSFIKTRETNASLIPIGYAQVLYDFEAEREDEISLKAGLKVGILEKTSNDWWRVEHNGLSGMVPANFLSEITDEDNSANWKYNEDQGASGGSGSKDFAKSMKSTFPTNQENDSKSFDSHNHFGGVFHSAAIEVPVEDVSSPKLAHSISDEDEKKRKDAISEFISTEKGYVSDLKMVVRNYMEPLTNPSFQLDISRLFSNILQISDLNERILEELATLSVHDNIGNIFLKHLDDLECYNIYCANLSNATSYLQAARNQNPQLNDFLKKQANEKCKNLDLSSYLLIPMQRITRYSLLLRQILHYTPKNHPEHDSTLIALQMSDEFLEKLNNSTRLGESRFKIEEITRILDLRIPEENYTLDLRKDTRHIGPRLFMFQGELQKNKSGRKLTGYLFNDMLLLVEPKSDKSGPFKLCLYREPLLLDEFTIAEATRVSGKDVGAIDNTCFQIYHANDIITLRCTGVSEKRQWMNQIDACRKAYSSKLTSKSPGKKSLKGFSDTIGTLKVSLIGARSLQLVGAYEIFAVVQLDQQVMKSKITRSDSLWNQSLLFSVSTLDTTLKIAVYKFDKYQRDLYLGQAEIQLDILEYYGSRETERMELPLKDVSSGMVYIKMMYRQA